MRLESGFLNSSTRYPNALAVVDGADRRTYAEVHLQAVRLAGVIDELMPAGPSRVGLCLERGPDAYVAILAVLLAGATYVPIGLHQPADRVKCIIEIAELDLIVADSAGLAKLELLRPVISLPGIIAPTEISGDDVNAGHAELMRSKPRFKVRSSKKDEHALAYLLFTSGSTGTPKGVPITHANVVSFLTENTPHYQLGPGDRCSQTFELTFDLSVFDIFMAWGAGACLYTMRADDLMDPVGFVQRHKLSVWFSVPSVAALVLQRGGLGRQILPSLRLSLFCGEALTLDVADAWSRAAPAATLENLYGPTELTIACTRYVWREHSPQQATRGIVPIGKPFSNMRALIVDSEGREAAAGEIGELCFSGAQQFTGYWRAPELTDNRMLALHGQRYYRTGDRAFKRNGLLHFVGRVDNQVQVSGHRVELGDVESALRSIPDVIEAIAFGLPHQQPSVQCLGAAVSVIMGSEFDARALRRVVAALVPDYMRPRRISIVDQFPLNTNGKIDRRATLLQLSELL